MSRSYIYICTGPVEVSNIYIPTTTKNQILVIEQFISDDELTICLVYFFLQKKEEIIIIIFQQAMESMKTNYA